MNTPDPPTSKPALDYENPATLSENTPTTVQDVDVTMLWIFAILAFIMSTLFVIAVPLCIIALIRNGDVVVVIGLICAVGMSAGLIGTGVGLIRRARSHRLRI